MNLVRMLPFEVNLWKAQNVYYALLRTLFPSQMEARMRTPEDGWKSSAD